MNKTVLILLVMSFVIYPQYRWEQTKGPLTGLIHDMAFSDGTLYFATYNGVFRSIDNGQSFEKFGRQGRPPESTITAITADDKFIYSAGYYGLMRRDKNSEDIWIPLNYSSYYTILDIVTNNAGTLFINTYIGNEVLRSNDYGLTWEKLTGLPNAQVNSMILTEGEDIYLGYVNGPIYKSTDNGSSWVLKANGLPNSGEVTLMEDHIGNIYAGFTQGGYGLYRSEDGGDTWHFVNNTYQNYFNFLHKGPDGYIYCGSEAAVYRSNDGITWTYIWYGLRKYYVGLNAVNNDQGEMFFGMHSGLYKTTNNGAEFTRIGLPVAKITALTTEDNGDIYAGGETYLFRSSDDGMSWQIIDGIDETGILTLFNTSQNTILVGVNGSGILRKGSSWSRKLTGNKYVQDITQSPEGTIIAVERSLLYKSNDDGVTWDSLPGSAFMGNNHSAAFFNDTLFVASGAGVYSSGDSGITFYPAGTGLLAYVNQLYSCENLFAATGEGVYMYYKGKWELTPGELTTERLVYRLAAIDNKLYAATDSGIYVSSLTDPKWKAYNYGLEDMIVLSLTSDRYGMPVAGTYNASVYRWKEPTITDVEDFINPDNFLLQGNYPNPFNPVTTIKFNLTERSKIILKIFDVLGNEIITLINEEMHPGIHEVKWNAGTMPSGVYFYRLQANAKIETRKMLLLK